MKKFVFFVSLVMLLLLLTSCMLVKDNTPPAITNFTTSSTLLSRMNISFSADVIDTGSGVDSVVFEIDGSPLPTSQKGTSVYVSNWFGVYGSHRVTILAEDRAGNLATKKDRFFVADSTPPVVNVKFPKAVAVGVKFPIILKVYDLQSGVESVSMTIDGENVPLISDAVDWTFSDIGAHKISVTVFNGQGLATTKNFEITSINARNVPPYVQFVKCPRVFKSGKSATFTVYAYSSNGIGEVDLKFGDITRVLTFNPDNVYTFVINVPNIDNGISQATCTVTDGVGIKKRIHEEIMTLSKDSTANVIIPKFSVKTVVAKIPFFVGAVSNSAKVSASIDGIPVDVEGDFPKMFALSRLAPGKHRISVALNGKVFGKSEFSSSLPPVKIIGISKTSTELTVEFSGQVEAYADPVFELSFGDTSTILIGKKDVVVKGETVSFPISMVPTSCSIKVIGLRDIYGRVIKSSFKILESAE